MLTAAIDKKSRWQGYLGSLVKPYSFEGLLSYTFNLRCSFPFINAAYFAPITEVDHYHGFADLLREKQHLDYLEGCVLLLHDILF